MGGVSTVTQTGNDLLDVLAGMGLVAASLSAIALAARKPPLRWIGHWIAWIFRRLIGDPLSVWLARETEDRVRPIVREEVVKAAAEVNFKIDDLHDCLDQEREERVRLGRIADDTNRRVQSLATEFTDHRGDVTRILDERGVILDRALPLIEKAEPLIAELEERATGPTARS